MLTPGLDTLHQLTSDKPHKLRVELEDFAGKTAAADYASFRYVLPVWPYSGPRYINKKLVEPLIFFPVANVYFKNFHRAAEWKSESLVWIT